MIELAIPARLTPGQTFLVLVVAGGILAAMLARSLLEAAVLGIIKLFLKLIGHRPPRRSSFSTVLDEFEARTRKEEGPHPDPPPTGGGRKGGST